MDCEIPTPFLRIWLDYVGLNRLGNTVRKGYEKQQKVSRLKGLVVERAQQGQVCAGIELLDCGKNDR